MWAYEANKAEYRDIFLIEALGTLLLLTTFPKNLRSALWLHFFDNEGAESSLIKGSSRIDAGDNVIGLTWCKIERAKLWFYCDRVASESNPVDGLSRGRKAGAWQKVQSAKFPCKELAKLATELDENRVKFGPRKL